MWGDYDTKILRADPANLVFYGGLDERTGTTAVDKSQFGNNGTYVSTTLDAIASPFGTSAAFFDGSNDRVSLSAAVADMDEQQGTMGAWFKIAADEWIDGEIREGISIYHDSGEFIRLGKQTATDKFRFDVVPTTGSQLNAVWDSSGTTGWFHAAATWDLVPSTKNARIFINGVFITNNNDTDTVLDAVTAMSIGVQGDAADAKRFLGHIHKPFIFKSILTDPVIENIGHI